MNCTHPDRDCPGVLCGYPLPCPHHTVTLDTTTDPPELRIPVTAHRALRCQGRLAKVLKIIAAGVGETSKKTVARKKRGKVKKKRAR